MKPQHILAANASWFDTGTGSPPASELVIAQRQGLESNEAYRQVLPYVVLMNARRLLVYRRTPAGGEPGLHGKHSVGFGGHVDLADVMHRNSVIDLEATLRRCAEREIAEELAMPRPPTIVSAGWWIVASDTAVDRVHAGIVHVAECESEMVVAAEPDIEIVGWLYPHEVINLPNLETWSRLVAEHYARQAEMRRVG